MGDPSKRYLRQVGRRLYCAKEEKVQLLDGLRAEMADVFSPGETLTVAKLSARLGTPADVAAELQGALSDGEAGRRLKRRHRRLWCGLVACIVIIALMAGYFYWASNFDKHYVYETKIGIDEWHQVG